MSRQFVVVGAGPSGLGCATELASLAAVSLVERTPVIGGEAGWQNPQVQDMARTAETAGVRLRLGGAAIRWKPGELLVASPGRMDRIPADHLFYAGGLRPATAMDLGMTGDRPAGVIPGTVAAHLLEAGVPLWHSIVLVGVSRWAVEIAQHVSAQGGSVVSVSADGLTNPHADRSVTGASGLRVRGRTRVEALTCRSEGQELELPCDALILTGPARPNRNIDGAISDPSPGVTYIQPTDAISVSDRFEHGRKVARTWINAQEGAS